LLCGADGLPHLISDPGLALKFGHAGEVFVSLWMVLGGVVFVCLSCPSPPASVSSRPRKRRARAGERSPPLIIFFALAHAPLPPPPAYGKKKSPRQIPTFGFLYVAGWIGYVGRNYLMTTKASKSKPTEAEYIIDVPMALKMAFQGAAWPAQVVEELKANTLVEKDENITISPR
jgi:hypothetical protein